MQVAGFRLLGLLHHIHRRHNFLGQHHHRRARSAPKRGHTHRRVGHPLLAASGERPFLCSLESCPAFHGSLRYGHCTLFAYTQELHSPV